jgi:hypothetical protein
VVYLIVEVKSHTYLVGNEEDKEKEEVDDLEKARVTCQYHQQEGPHNQQDPVGGQQLTQAFIEASTFRYPFWAVHIRDIVTSTSHTWGATQQRTTTITTTTTTTTTTCKIKPAWSQNSLTA